LTRSERSRELRASLASIAFGGDRTAMRFHQCLADGQTQPESAQLCSARLLERVKNFWQNFRRNPTTGIFHFDAQFLVAIICGANTELSAVGSKFNCVLD